MQLDRDFTEFLTLLAAHDVRFLVVGDLLISIDGVEFEACFARRAEVVIDGLAVPFIALADLRRNTSARCCRLGGVRTGGWSPPPVAGDHGVPRSGGLRHRVALVRRAAHQRQEAGGTMYKHGARPPWAAHRRSRGLCG